MQEKNKKTSKKRFNWKQLSETAREEIAKLEAEVRPKKVQIRQWKQVARNCEAMLKAG